MKDLKTVAATFSRILRGMQHERIKYQELDEKLKEDKSNMSVKILDEDLENKIKQLESNNKPLKPEEGSNGGN